MARNWMAQETDPASREAPGSLTEAAGTADAGHHVTSGFRALLGGRCHMPEGHVERLAAAKRLREGCLSWQERVEQRLVTKLRLAQVLDRCDARRQHAVEQRAVDLVGTADGTGHVEVEGTVERPHGAPDLGHQHLAEHRQPPGQVTGLLAQDLAGAQEALVHVDAVIAVTGRAVDLAQSRRVLVDARDERVDDGLAVGSTEAVHLASRAVTGRSSPRRRR